MVKLAAIVTYNDDDQTVAGYPCMFEIESVWKPGENPFKMECVPYSVSFDCGLEFVFSRLLRSILLIPDNLTILHGVHVSHHTRCSDPDISLWSIEAHMIEEEDWHRIREAHCGH